MTNLQIVRPDHVETVLVHRREDRFAAWPFNGGVWKYPGDEIVVGFVSRTCHYDPAMSYEVNHGYNPCDGQGGFMLARSLDGGRTWEERILQEKKDLDWKLDCGNALPYDDPIDFTDPNLLIGHYGPNLLLSLDRGRTFIKAQRIQSARKAPHTPYERAKMMGRPDYVIRPDGACVLLTTISSQTGVEGRPATYLSRNGALSWERFGLIGEEPQHFMRIMPSGVWLPSGRMIVAVRCQVEGHGTSFWAEVYASDDGGRTWSYLSRVNDLGSPCHLLLLDDGRVLASYGYRSAPFGVRARLSKDDGVTWGPEIILRDDGKSWDLGYPKSVQMDGGDIVTVYYFNAKDDPVDISGGVRHIAATRWQAP